MGQRRNRVRTLEQIQIDVAYRFAPWPKLGDRPLSAGREFLEGVKLDVRVKKH